VLYLWVIESWEFMLFGNWSSSSGIGFNKS